jgi:hypothetical protein
VRPRDEDDGVLRLLAAGMSLDAIESRLVSERGPTPAGARRDPKAILDRAAALVRDKSLLPPAEAAFLEKHGIATSELDQLRSLSERLLRTSISEASRSSVLPDPKHERRHYTALRYAEALVRQDEILDALSRVDSSNAPLQSGLTEPDRKRIDDFLIYRGTKGRFETLDSLTDVWERSVAWVEDKGESYTHDEFVDRLITRDSLEDALSLVSPAGREPLESRVRPLDQRFLHGTRAVSTSIRPPSPWRFQGWWWFRVPRRIGKSFQARLEHVAPAAAQEALTAHKGAMNQRAREGRE